MLLFYDGIIKGAALNAKPLFVKLKHTHKADSRTHGFMTMMPSIRALLNFF
jgi:hypothetical protein